MTLERVFVIIAAFWLTAFTLAGLFFLACLDWTGEPWINTAVLALVGGSITSLFAFFACVYARWAWRGDL